MYDDGLVRIATEEYSEDPEKLYDSCVHVCNYAINCKNKEKFIYNNNPSECEGNKVWILNFIWYLMIIIRFIIEYQKRLINHIV